MADELIALALALTLVLLLGFVRWWCVGEFEKNSKRKPFDATLIAARLVRVRQDYAKGPRRRWRPAHCPTIFAVVRQRVAGLSYFHHLMPERELQKHDR
jgi:hypothetical protein